MELHGIINYKKAIVVDEIMLRNIHCCLEKYFETPKYSVDLFNENRINFENIEELLNYDNYASMRIKTLHINWGYYKNNIVFNPSISFFNSYQNSVTVEYVLDDTEKSILFEEEMNKILEKGKREWYYTSITKVSLFHFLILLLSISIGGGIYLLYNNPQIDMNWAATNALTNMGIVLSFVLFLVAFLLAKSRDIIFPVISYKLGEQIKVLDKNEKFVSNIFWVVIVGIILTFITSRIF